MNIHCCECNKEVEARLTNGKEVYPRFKSIHSLPFWICDECGNFVGCHHKSSTPTKPLGCIPTPELKKARMQIHDALDAIWKSGKKTRKEAYAYLSKKLKKEYHTAEIRSIDEASKVYKYVMMLGLNSRT